MKEKTDIEEFTADVLTAIRTFSEDEVLGAIDALEEVSDERVDLKSSHRRIAELLWKELYDKGYEDGPMQDDIESVDDGPEYSDALDADYPGPGEDLIDSEFAEEVDEKIQSVNKKSSTRDSKPTTEKKLATSEATRLLFDADFVRQYLCPALKSASNDAFDIAKTMTPVLAALSLAGVITLSLNPLIFAALSLLIARMGIATLCADKAEEK